MRAFAMLLVLAATCVVGCKTGPQPVASIADQIRHSTSSYWSITTSNNTIFISSKTQVLLMSRINPPEEFSPNEDSPFEKSIFEKYGMKTPYEVVLSFIPRMTDTELNSLREKRRPYENIRTRSMAVYFDAQRHLQQIPFPSFYTDKYSIFVEPPPYGDGWQVYPPEAVQQVNDLTNVLMKTFREY
jgi:hypothetical protein